MPKFTLIAEHDDIYGNPSGHKITHEFKVEHISTVLENFDLFLRGVGYTPSGTLDYVDDETYYGLDSEMYDEQDIASTKSSYFFDTQRNR